MAAEEVHTEGDSPAELRKKFIHAQKRVQKAVHHYDVRIMGWKTSGRLWQLRNIAQWHHGGPS